MGVEGQCESGKEAGDGGEGRREEWESRVGGTESFTSKAKLRYFFCFFKRKCTRRVRRAFFLSHRELEHMRPGKGRGGGMSAKK